MVSEMPFHACEQKNPISELHCKFGSAESIDQSGGNKSSVKKTYKFSKLPSISDQSPITSSIARRVSNSTATMLMRSFLFILLPIIVIIGHIMEIVIKNGSSTNISMNLIAKIKVMEILEVHMTTITWHLMQEISGQKLMIIH